MSRILRRPMFRGGPVSSYGTGIAAPLVPGYQGGGQIGGGIIYGKPMADGRYGFQDVELFDVKDAIGEIETGQKITDENVPASNWEDLVAQEKFKSETIYDEDYLTEKFDDFVLKNKKNIETGGISETDLAYGMQIAQPISAEQQKFYDVYQDNPEQAYEYWKNDITNWGEKQEKQATEASNIGAKVDFGIETDVIPTELTPDQLRIQELENALAEKAEPTDIDAKAMVAENKELFADLLGIDKARGADISDMLLGFAGAEGDDTWSKFKAFTRDEAKRPGRRQKIEDAAGTLAIQDYIAGKRSKEQIEKLKGVETFKLDEQKKRLYPQADDDWLTAVRKSAGKDDSYSSSKVLKKALAGKFDTPLINPDQTKKDLAEISKDKEDFAIGFTIVTLKDGRKVIIEKTETDIKVRTDLPVF